MSPPDPVNPYAAPTGSIGVGPLPPGNGSPYFGEAPATFGIRVGARLLDTLVGGALGFGVGLAIGFLHLAHPHGVAVAGPKADALARALSQAMSPGRLALAFLGPIAYHTLAESLSGATLGKLACGLRVRNEQLGPVSIGAALIRSLLYFVDGFCCGMVAYFAMNKSPRAQRLGDQAAKTVVVTKPPGGHQAVNPVGIVVGLLAWAACVLAGRLV